MKYLSSISSDNCDVTFVNGTFTGDLTVDTNTLYVDSTNNRVGIGTTSPSGELHVKSASANANFYIQRSIYDPWRLSAGSTYLAFMQDASEKMRIDSSGSVGIGTSSPSVELEVGGSTNTQVLISATNTTGNSQLYFGDSASDTAGVILYRHDGDSMAFEVNDSERMRIISDGSVGIGTTSPSAKLMVYADTNGSLVTKVRNNNIGTSAYAETQYSSGTSGNELRVGVSHNYASTQWNNAWVYAINRDLALKAGSIGKSIKFYANGNLESDVKAIINSNGNLLIGTTTDSGYKLDVSGAAQVSHTSNEIVNLNTTNANGGYTAYKASGTAKGFVGFGSTLFTGLDINNFGIRSQGGLALASGGGNVRLYINSSGSVGIGTTSPGYTLDVNGSLHSLLINGVLLQEV
jgi:hypothetical protein